MLLGNQKKMGKLKMGMFLDGIIGFKSKGSHSGELKLKEKFI